MDSSQYLANLIERAKKYTKIHEEKLKAAYDFAVAAHAGQTRISGDPYISHPLAVANLLIEYKADEESLIVALLHDVIEDSSHTINEINEKFGKTIGTMVDSLTKLPRIHNIQGFQDASLFDYKIESLRKIFEIMQQDSRVMVIKLCDRLHNMESLDFFRAEKQKRIAQETFDIYVKIADRLCMMDMKEKLEEMCFKYLFPEAYIKIQEEKEKYNHVLGLYKKYIHEKVSLCRHLPHAKDIIFQQYVAYGHAIEQKNEQPKIETRVIVIMDTEDACYLALREIHSQWKSLRDKVRDYIHLPKSNGFQGLRTTIVKRDGATVRITIQTEKMYNYGRNGVATMCFSKSEEGKKVKLPWMAQLKGIHKETKDSSFEYLTALRKDVFKVSIIIFVEGDKAIFLPPKSTALDAAFYHLGKNAFRLQEVFINEKKSYFAATLHDSQTIQFKLSDHEAFSYEWFYAVSTEFARSFIREKIREFSQANRITIGKDILQNELNRIRQGYVDEISDERKKEVTRTLSFQHWNDVLDALADGKLSVDMLLRTLFKFPELKEEENSYRLRIFRNNVQSLSLIQLLSELSSQELNIQHLKTIATKDGYHDMFLIRCSPIDLRSFLEKIATLYPHHTIDEFNPQRSLRLVIFLILNVIVWTLNPFFIRYAIVEGLSPIAVSWIRMLVGGVALFLFYLLRKYLYGISYQPIRFKSLFWIITMILTLNFILQHIALQTIQSSHFTMIMQSGFIFSPLLFALYLWYKRKKPRFKLYGIASLLSVFAIVLLLVQTEDSFIFRGEILMLGSLSAFFLYAFFNQYFQRVERLKDRIPLQLASIFFLGSLFHLPFLSYENLSSASFLAYTAAITNGILGGAMGHFIYFTLQRYYHQYLINFGMSFILPLVILIEIFVFGPYEGIGVITFILMYFGLLIAVLAEKRASEQIKLPLQS